MTDMLIVIDMQRDFVSGCLGSKEAQGIVPAVAARMQRAHEEGTPIVLTLDTHEEDYMETREGRFLPVAHCIRGSEGWTLEPEIGKACRRGMISFEKPTFGSTALMHHGAAAAGAKGCINGKGMTIELCGVCTDICVVSNALLINAALPEADLIVDSALCAGVTPEKHKAALETMRSCQIQVL